MMMLQKKIVLYLFLTVTLVIGVSCEDPSADDLSLNGTSTKTQKSVSEITSEELVMNQPKNTSWNTDEYSIHHWRTGCYARYFTFTLTKTTSVQIDLESRAYDSNYLFLIQGADPNGTVIASDLMSADKFVSEIIATDLEPGTYTIEAANYWDEDTGTFTIGVGTVTNSPVDRIINFGMTVEGSWIYSQDYRALSNPDSFVKRYAFTVPYASIYYPRKVHIHVVGSVTPVLYLLSPDKIDGTYLRAYVYGHNSEAVLDYSITRSGTYRVEVATYNDRTQGSFTIELK